MQAPDELAGWPVGQASAGALHRAGPAGPVEQLFVAGPAERTFPWASISKLCTALAFLVAMEEGTVHPHDAAGPPDSTVAHLLAHASGLGPAGEVLAPPGTRRIYSNEGFEVLSRYLAHRAAMPYAQYLTEAVLEPLGMTGVAVGTAGAGSRGLSGPLVDLLALARELLAPTLVALGTLDWAASVAFAGLDGVLPGFGSQHPCDWGMGFELRDGKHPHYTGAGNSQRTFGHFGQAGGFVWVDPDAGVAAAALTDRDFGPWAAEAWPRFSDAVLADAAHAGSAGAGAGPDGSDPPATITTAMTAPSP